MDQTTYKAWGGGGGEQGGVSGGELLPWPLEKTERDGVGGMWGRVKVEAQGGQGPC